MAKIANISGFPEWLPHEKLIEDNLISTIKKIYSLHGYTPIETRSVEFMSTLVSKGEISKEIYVLSRAQAEEREVKQESLALHFDLTVPFARYVAQNFSALSFPFKRYQLQKSWRGERPQEGRFREFYQFDIDVVSIDELPLCHDAEMITVISKIFNTLNLGSFKIKVNNRKILLGIYEHYGLTPAQRSDAVIIVDKIEKIGEAGVRAELLNKGISGEVADEIVRISKMQLAVSEFASTMASLGPDNELYRSGVMELSTVCDLLSSKVAADVQVDLSLARGLDYYTGIIIETVMTDYPSFGSVAGGGRYDNLTERFSNKKLPGVGIAIGVTRLMSLILSKNLIKSETRSTTTLLIALNSDAELKSAIEIAERLRSDGIAVEVFHKPLKLGKQIEYADKKGIRYVLFIKDDGSFEVKDLETKEQRPITLSEIGSFAVCTH